MSEQVLNNTQPATTTATEDIVSRVANYQPEQKVS